MNFLKNYRNYLSLTAFLLVSFMLVFTSCEKEGVSTNEANSINEVAPELPDINLEELKSKEVTITDENNENSVTLLVSSESQEVLDLFDAETFDVSFGTDVASMANLEESVENNSEGTVASITEESKIGVFIQVLEDNLRSGISFNLSLDKENSVELRAYNIDLLYSSGYYPGLRVICTGRGIDGVSVWACNSVTYTCNYMDTNSELGYAYLPYSGYYVDFRKSPGRPCLWVRVRGYYNYNVYYIN